MINGVLDLLTRKIFVGPGRRSLFSLYRRMGRSKYVPHQAAREILRRRRQIERGQLRPVTDASDSGVLGPSLVCGSRWLRRA